MKIHILNAKKLKQKNFFCLNLLHFIIHLLIKHKGETPNGTHRRNDTTVKADLSKARTYQDFMGPDGAIKKS